MRDPGNRPVLGGWYLLEDCPKRTVSRSVCTPGEATGKGSIPPAGLKEVRAGLPLPLAQSLSS